MKLAPDCRRLEWSFEGLPKGAIPDIETKGLCPFPAVSRGAAQVSMSGPAMGSAGRVFSFRARVSMGKAAPVLFSEWQDVGVPTPANSKDALGDLIVVKASLDANGQGTVDLDNVVLFDAGSRVRWDLSALRATRVGIRFSGPSGSDGLGPFLNLDENLMALTGSGNNGVRGHYTYVITAEIPDGARPRSSRRLTIRIDPGIDNVPPPPKPPPVHKAADPMGATLP